MGIIQNIFTKRQIEPGTVVAPFGSSLAYDNNAIGLNTRERDPRLTGTNLYVSFDNMALKNPVVAAGTRLTLDLISSSAWNILPASGPGIDPDMAKMYRDFCEDVLFEYPRTGFSEIVKMLAGYRFYGFSLSEINFAQDKMGRNVIYDIANRPQNTIERFITDINGYVVAVQQRHPTLQTLTTIEMENLIYLAEYGLKPAPEGTGIFRSIIDDHFDLLVYKKFLEVASERDARGLLILRAPTQELAKQVKENAEFTQADANKVIEPISNLAQNYNRGKRQLGVILDSEVYETVQQDTTTRPSAARKYDIDLLQGNGSCMADIRQNIRDLYLDIARGMGVHHILLGASGSGNRSLAEDQSIEFVQTINSTMRKIARCIKRDLLRKVFEANSYPLEYMPMVSPEFPRFVPPETQAYVLKTLNEAGLMDDDPAINQVRTQIGVLPQPTMDMEDERMDMEMGPEGNQPPVTQNLPRQLSEMRRDNRMLWNLINEGNYNRRV